MKINKKYSGVSLVELLIGIAIMGILASVITLSANSVQATAKSEAEKVAQFLRTQINNADKRHDGILISGDKNHLRVTSHDIVFGTIRASSGCAYSYSHDSSSNGGQIYYHNRIEERKPRIESADVSINVSSQVGKGGEYDFYVGVNGKGNPYYVNITPIGEGVKIKQ